MDGSSIDAWLLLQQLPGLSGRHLGLLISMYGDAEGILAAADDELENAGVSSRWLRARREALRRPAKSDAAQSARAARGTIADLGARVLPLTHSLYPALLKETVDPPPLLTIRGDIALFDRPALAMVGSRRCTRAGADTASGWARELAAAGMVIVSGLALGIDAESHRGALAADGATIAVLGTGIDVPYPSANRRLYATIAERGLLVSEFPPGFPPRREQFPQRNRIISGISLGVLVVEAALRSGSLITARLAMEQNREVFAVPGSIHNPASRGCNALIRDGATLVQSAADIIDGLRGWTQPLPLALAAESSEPSLSPEEQEVVAELGFEPTPVDALVLRSRRPVAELLPILSGLELRGLVEESGGCWIRCR